MAAAAARVGSRCAGWYEPHLLGIIHFFVVLKVKSYNKNYSHPFLCVVSAYCRYLHIIIVISLWNIKKSSDVRRQAMNDQGIMYA